MTLTTRQAVIAAALSALPAGIGMAALTLMVDPDASYPQDCNAQVFPDGKFRADDGRPSSLTDGQCQDWLMNQAVADVLIAQLAKRGRILYDYDHKSIWGDTAASGWIVALVYVAGRGLFAKVEWTPSAAKKIAEKEFLYSSPYFLFKVATGEITELISVALTNDPALGDLGGVGLSKTTKGGNKVPNPDDQQQAALATQVADLTKKLDAANTELAALRKEKEDAALAQEKAEREELLDAALNDGHIAPAQKEWAEGLSLAELKKFLKTTEPLAILGKQSQRQGQGDGNHGLTEDQLAWCNRMGVTPEQYKEAQKSLA